MAIPDYQSIMLPLLKFAGDSREHSLRETIEYLAVQFRLSEDERKLLLPSGRQATFDNRVGWARTYLKKAGLLEATRRAHFQISERGLDALKSNPKIIDNRFLRQYPEFLEFQGQENQPSNTDESEDEDSKTPEEVIEEAFLRVQRELSAEILKTVVGCSPAFFEQLVVDLIVKMGYGGTRKDAGQAIGKSGDGGIDGIIKEDRLGLDIVYIQAKRWDGSSISRPEIQKFAGALQGQRARKGIFITTSTFTKGAQDFAASIDTKIVLIDGEMLAQLMIDYNIGVNTFATYELKRIDSDYFTED